MNKKCKDCGKEFNTKWQNVVYCEDCRRPYGREDNGLKDVLESIKNKEQRETLQRWANKRLSNAYDLKGTVARLYTLRKIAKALNKPFEKCTEEDIEALLSKPEFSKKYHRKLTKQFFEAIKIPGIVAGINTRKSAKELANTRKKITLTEAQAKEILSKCDSPMDRAIFELFADNPLRPKDLEALRVKDVHIDENGVILSFRSKTEAGCRDVFLRNAKIAFLKYWENQPFKSDPEKPVFYSQSSNSYGKPLLWGGMQGRFKRIVKRAKLPEEIKPLITLYTWRRTVATWLLTDPDYTPKEVQRMGGWASIRMLDVYGKITDDMVNKKKMVVEAKRSGDAVAIKKLKEQAKKDSTLAKIMAREGLLDKDDKYNLLGTVVCPKCKQQNLSDADFCSRCWLPLKKDIIDVKEETIKESINKQIPLTRDLVKEVIADMIAEGKIKV
jgi:integrase